MRIHLWGMDYRRGTHETRKALNWPEEERRSRLQNLLTLGFQDVVYLATCNRVEFYTTAQDPFCDTRHLWLSLLKSTGLSPDVFHQGYHLEGKAALRHLLRVAASLESMVVGEPQILGQLKDALQFARSADIQIDPGLERVFQLTFETAKKIRTETAIGSHAVSIASLGLRRLEARENEIPVKSVAFVGRSPITVQAVQWVKKNRPGAKLFWANRSVDRLKELPESEGVSLCTLDDFLKNPPSFSHLFTATASHEPIFQTDFFRGVCGQSLERRLVFDFAEPADVVACPELPIEWIQIESLQEEAEKNRNLRSAAISEAEIIIDAAVKEFLLAQKEAPLLREFSEVEPSLFASLEVLYREWETLFPEAVRGKFRKVLENQMKKQLHLSREHLRGILHKVTEPACP